MSSLDAFFRQIYENLKIVLNLPDAEYVDPVKYHISSPQSASKYLGVLTDGRGHVDGFKSYTIQAAPSADTIEWYWEPVKGTHTGVFFTVESSSYHWHYDSDQQQVNMGNTSNKGNNQQPELDASFASDESNIFNIVGADNPYRINHYTASTQFVEYNADNTATYLPVIPHQSIYTEFSFETAMNNSDKDSRHEGYCIIV